MSENIRYAIFAAVSSERQAAADKISLVHQEETARTRANTKGWIETAGPYVVPGETRTRWINLRDAEDAIPQLRQMLNAAQRGEFDVLVIYDYSRLRELTDPVSRALAAYRVQVYSCVQAVDPVPPSQFDGKVTATAYIVQSMSNFASHSEIDTMTRRLRSGIEGRIPRGLHPSGATPYGYRRTPKVDNANNASLVIEPSEAAVILKIKDMYMAGKTAKQIREYMQENGIPSPNGKKEWCDTAVYRVLSNPFYAGEVGIGYYRTVLDPRTGKKRSVRNHKDKIRHAPGKHQALWDMQTHIEIQAEIKRRGRSYKGRATYRLSLLLRCARHGTPLKVRYINNLNGDRYRVWHCTSGEKGHWCCFIHDNSALEQLAEKLQDELSNTETHDIEKPEKATLLQSAIDDLLARRDRLTDALETGALAADVYATRTKSITQRLDEIRKELADIDTENANRNQQNYVRNELSKILTETKDFLFTGDPQQVNTQLRVIIDKIYLNEDKTIKVIFR